MYITKFIFHNIYKCDYEIDAKNSFSYINFISYILYKCHMKKSI